MQSWFLQLSGVDIISSELSIQKSHSEPYVLSPFLWQMSEHSAHHKDHCCLGSVSAFNNFFLSQIALSGEGNRVYAELRGLLIVSSL